MTIRDRLALLSVASVALLVACGGGTASPATSSNAAPPGARATPSPAPAVASATPAPNHGSAAIDLQLGAPALKVGMSGDETAPPALFVPADVTVHVGDIVEWDYSPTGFVPHNVVFGEASELSSRPLGGKPDGSPGVGTWQVRFTIPGTYRYLCTFHRSTMVGSVTVS